jgi:hypothetical protein
LRVLVLSLRNTAAIPSPLTLFTCRVTIAADAVPGVYPLEISNVETSTSEGTAYDTIGVGGSVTVLAAPAGLLRLDAASGVCSGGRDADQVCFRRYRLRARRVRPPE